MPSPTKKELEQSVEELEEQLKLQDNKRVEAIKTLAGGVAHNVNNPLTPIQGYASLMRSETERSHPNYNMLSSIMTAGEAISKITDLMLMYAGIGRYRIGPINLNERVEETSKTFGVTKAP